MGYWHRLGISFSGHIKNLSERVKLNLGKFIILILISLSISYRYSFIYFPESDTTYFSFMDAIIYFLIIFIVGLILILIFGKKPNKIKQNETEIIK